MRPLSNIRILDLSRVFAGPWATQMLGDLGAEVIKVERPGRGDDVRGLGPPFLHDATGAETRESAFYLSVNRNKKSVTIDIAHSDGQQIVRALAKTADVIVENYKVGTLARYGLDYQSIRTINPEIIYCSVTGFGQTGPAKHRPGYDTLFQAMGGLMGITGNPDDAPGGGPVKVGLVFADMMTGMYASSAILSALYHRAANGGRGQYIDIALLDSQVAALSHQAMYYLVSGANPQRIGTSAPTVVPSQMFRCSDGYIALVVGNDGQFGRFCGAIEHEALGSDERFATNALRVKNRALLIPLLEQAFAIRPIAHWLGALEGAGIAAGPINSISDVFEDAQVKSRELLVEVPHPVSGSVKLLTSPMRMSETPLSTYTAPPTIGQHTDEVLQSILGLGAPEIASLRERSVV